MKTNTFKPEDYFDLPLCEALDRIARAAGIIDAHSDPFSKRFRDMPSEATPWLFIDWQRFDAERRSADHDENSPINFFLWSRPALDEPEAYRLKIAKMEAAALQLAMRAFEDAVEPLFVALRAGSIVARGFLKRKKQADVNATAIDGARWRMEWQLRRNGSSAICEFFNSRAEEDAEVILTGLHLVAPAVAGDVPVINTMPGAAGALQMTFAPKHKEQKSKSGRKAIDDTKPLLRLREILLAGDAKTVNAAITRMLQDDCKRPKNPLVIEGASDDAIHERLRRKLDASYIVEENSDGVTLKLREPA